MRYKLTAGNVLGPQGFFPIGSEHELSDEEAARWRLGGCELTEVKPALPIAAEPAKPKRRGRPRKSRTVPDANAEG